MCDRNRLGLNRRSSNESVYEFLERLRLDVEKVAIKIGKPLQMKTFEARSKVHKNSNICDRKVLISRLAAIARSSAIEEL